MPDHPRPLEHLVRPQPAGAADPEFGVSRPRAAARADRRHRAFLADHAVAPDPAGGIADRRGSDLRPPRSDGYDPLHAFIALFENRTIEKAEKKGRPEKLEERLAQRIVDGDRQDLEADLDLAMESYKPLDIINDILLDG